MIPGLACYHNSAITLSIYGQALFRKVEHRTHALPAMFGHQKFIIKSTNSSCDIPICSHFKGL